MAGVLVVICLVLFGVSALVVDRLEDRRIARSETLAFDLMQRAADRLADDVGHLLAPLDEINRLGGLALQLGDSGNEAGKAATIKALAGVMPRLILGPVSIESRDAHGTPLLHVGDEPAGSPDEQIETGLGVPWDTGGGKVAEHYWSRMADRPDLAARITFDPVALSSAMAGELPVSLIAQTPSVSSLVRLADGVMSARSERPQSMLGQRQHASVEALAKMRISDHGAMRLISAFTHVDTIVGFRLIPELGLSAVVSSRASDLLAVAQLQSRLYRRAPWVVLLGSICVSAVWLVLLTRHRAAAVLERERRLAEAARAARAELEHLVKCSPALLYRGKLDRDGVYTRDFVTPNAKAITGWEPEMLSDPERMWRLSSEEDRHLRGTNYARALRDGRSSIEYRFLRPDGGFSWLRNEAVITLRNADGSAEVAGAITNVTREREMAALAAMQNRMATLGQIATSLAHELTQPVTVIGMAAAIAQSMAAEEAAHPDLRIQIDAILAQADRAGEMIRHLRSYGHADGGPLTGVPLRQALDGALTLAGTALQEAGVVIEIVVADGLPLVRGRLVQVEQVLVNLMLNARDAMRGVPAAERRLRIHARSGDLVQLHVADSGPGIPPDVIPRLFEAFYTTKPPGEGTGLGLALCDTMMRSFGGAIRVGRPPKGALFILEFLPASRMAGEASITADSAGLQIRDAFVETTHGRR